MNTRKENRGMVGPIIHTAPPAHIHVRNKGIHLLLNNISVLFLKGTI